MGNRFSQENWKLRKSLSSPTPKAFLLNYILHMAFWCHDNIISIWIYITGEKKKKFIIRVLPARMRARSAHSSFFSFSTVLLLLRGIRTVFLCDVFLAFYTKSSKNPISDVKSKWDSCAFWYWCFLLNYNVDFFLLCTYRLNKKNCTFLCW